jgi:hypothetical protein
MRSASPNVSNACVMPGALFTMNVSTAHATSITIAAMSPRSMVFFY